MSSPEPIPPPAAPRRLARLRDLPPRRRWLYATLAVAGAVIGIAFVWTVSHAVSIHRLTRGVGDTVFYTADGRPWFRLDEHRRDVPLADIATDLQHAVVAVEDHRFYRHVGVDAIALG